MQQPFPFLFLFFLGIRISEIAEPWVVAKKEPARLLSDPLCNSHAENNDEGYGGSGGMGGGGAMPVHMKRGSFTQTQNDLHGDQMVPTSKALHISLDDNPNMIVYLKVFTVTFEI